MKLKTTGNLNQLLNSIEDSRQHPEKYQIEETEISLCPYCNTPTDELDLCCNILCDRGDYDYPSNIIFYQEEGWDILSDEDSVEQKNKILRSRN